MCSMFNGTIISNINLNNVNTTNVTNMSQMFYNFVDLTYFKSS